MKILQLTAENFKKLKAVQITPEGNVIQITGANEQGKSAVLDAIWAAIDAAGFLKETKTKEPIRQGEKKATITLDLGEIIITRKFLPSGASVEVATKDGACYKSPQALLDALIGKISFDPLAFSTMDEKKQKELLLSLVKIDLDISDIALSRQVAFDTRAEVNRTVKQLEAQFDGIPAVPANTPTEETPASVVLEAQHLAQAHNDANKVQRNTLEALRAEARAFIPLIDQCTQAVEDLKAQIKGLEVRISDKEVEKINHLQNKDKIIEKGTLLAAVVEKLEDVDMLKFSAELAVLDEINQAVRQKKERDRLSRGIAAGTAKSEALTQTLADLDQQKADAIKAATFPVDGMAFDDSGVIYKGIPFAQCSSAERLRVSIAMAMSMNPKLRVIRIADGSLLDKKNMAIIEEMAKAHDFQCFIERVDESGTIGIVIEDGSIKEVSHVEG
jgi:predicted ATP-dependent endonuclease of OLD family